MTTGLERRAHRLVELARAGDDPSASQILSLHGAVAARIAAEGASAASAAAMSAKAASAGAFVKGLVAAGAMATGAASFFGLPAAPPQVVPPPVVLASPSAAAALASRASKADAARVFAPCAAGRVDKARTAAVPFVQRYP